jgi:hypothetical protein
MSKKKDELMRKRERIFLEELPKLLSKPEAKEKIDKFKRRWRIADDAVWHPLSEPVDVDRRRAWEKHGLYRDHRTFMARPPCDIDWVDPRGTYFRQLRLLAEELDLLPDNAGLLELLIWNVVSIEDLAKIGWKDLYRLASERHEKSIVPPFLRPVGLTGWLAIPILDVLQHRHVTVRQSPHSSEADYRAVSHLTSRYKSLFPSKLKQARDRRGGTKRGRATGMRPATKEKYRRICKEYDRIKREHPDLMMREIVRMIGEPRSTINRALLARVDGLLE